MGLQPTHGNENLFLPLPLVIPSGAGPRRGTAQSRDLHFSRLSCLSHVVRMFFDRAKPKGSLFFWANLGDHCHSVSVVV